MKNSSLPLLLLLAFAGCKAPTAPSGPFGGDSVTPPQTHASASFDYYLLNLSWSPEFCHSHPTAAECAAHPAFVLHGLWPENNDGTYPQSCSTAPGPTDPSQYSDLYPDPSLLQHEWTTHGTCSGLSPDDYFNDARKAYKAVVIPPKLAGLTAQASLAPADIIGLFTASNPQVPTADFAISCGNNYLTAVEMCLDKSSLQPIACSGVNSCKANVVKIPPP